MASTEEFNNSQNCAMMHEEWTPSTSVLGNVLYTI